MANTNFVLISLMVLSLCIAPSFQHHSNIPGDYDSYAFATEWPGSVCKIKHCTTDDPRTTHMNLHGLWPGDWQNPMDYPEDCRPDHFNINSLPSDLKAELDEYWSGLYSSQQVFIDHEWDKHGTCWVPDYNKDPSKVPPNVRDIITEATEEYAKKNYDPQYFLRLAIGLAKDYDIIKVLAAANIVPNDSKTYRKEEFVEAIQKNFKITNFGLSCLKNSNSHRPNMFGSVLLCLDKQYKVISCVSMRDNCHDEMSFPTNPHSHTQRAETE